MKIQTYSSPHNNLTINNNFLIPNSLEIFNRILSYLNEDGILSADSPVISDECLVRGYQSMVITRLVDEQLMHLHKQGAISFAISSLGEEACAVAGAAALSMEDWIYPQYRETGVMFWRGLPISQFMHQMFGNAKDIQLGRQMPHHFGSRALNVVHVSSTIATQIPQAAGCAYAMKLQKEDKVALCFFGEGGTSESDFHVGLNFAAVTKAPVIFLCRNNGYAISTQASKQFASEGIAPKGIGYGISTLRVDGNDFFAVYHAVLAARQHCLAGLGPVLIEAMTYRMGAHSTVDDPSVYRTCHEVELWRPKCPLLRLRKYLERRELWDESKEKGYQKTVLEEIDQAVFEASQTPPPPLHSLIEDVYFEVPKSLRRQFEELNTIINKSSFYETT